MKGKKTKRKGSIIFKSVFGIVMLLVIFSLLVSLMGFDAFTEALLEQYEDGAFSTAKTAVSEFDGSKVNDYAESGGTTEEYLSALKELKRLCDSSGSSLLYVIRPDLTDYKHITFLFSTVGENSGFTPLEFGHLRNTTNDEYIEKYKKLYAGESDSELVIRDRGYIETDPHITAMVPIKDADGKTTAILCVQRQMENLVHVRNTYIGKVFIVMIILMIIVILFQSKYLHHVLLRPVKKITAEALRFSHKNDLPEKKLSETVKNNDEIGVLAGSIDNMEERIVEYVDELTKATAEKERVRAELNLAAKIQASMLPNNFPAFPDRTEFDIFASMDPAKEVGGDFYDFFLVDDDHLCLIIADVSGKGVPAALFMMSAKIILSDYAKMGMSPSEILTAANNAICQGEHEDMFVTVWLGILELSTGTLTAANAGHEYPIIMQPGGKFELLQDDHDIVVGIMPEVKYSEYTINMQPGSKLFVYTDGVPEATNSEKELFDTERMVAALNENPGASVRQLLSTVRGAVDAFVKDAEQFDDLTMMGVERK